MITNLVLLQEQAQAGGNGIGSIVMIVALIAIFNVIKNAPVRGHRSGRVKMALAFALSGMEERPCEFLIVC